MKPQIQHNMLKYYKEPVLLQKPRQGCQQLQSFYEQQSVNMFNVTDESRRHLCLFISLKFNMRFGYLRNCN